MKTAKYAAAEFVKVGACALLKGVQHDGSVVIVTTPVQSYDPITGVIETKTTRYITDAAPPAKLYKPAHGGYPG